MRPQDANDELGKVGSIPRQVIETTAHQRVGIRKRMRAVNFATKSSLLTAPRALKRIMLSTGANRFLTRWPISVAKISWIFRASLSRSSVRIMSKAMAAKAASSPIDRA